MIKKHNTVINEWPVIKKPRIDKKVQATQRLTEMLDLVDKHKTLENVSKKLNIKLDVLKIYIVLLAAKVASDKLDNRIKLIN